MLKTMRASFHQLKWTLFVVIIVFVLGFVFFSGSNMGGDVENQVIAKMGSDQISAAEFDRMYQNQIQRYREMYKGSFTPELARALDLPRQVLDGMIDRKLRIESARRLKLTVSDEELAREIAALPYFQENGQFIGADKYNERLKLAGMQPEIFEEGLREDLLVRKYETLVKASVAIPEADIRRQFSAQNDKATIEYILVPASRLESAVEPSEADLKAYYDKNRERYRAPEQRRANYLLVDKIKVRARVPVTDAEIRAEYEAKKATFAVPELITVSHILVAADPNAGPDADAKARAKTEALIARLAAGEDFAKLARENTDDPNGKENGGQLPPFGRGQMVPEFENVAFELKPGEVRGPVKTSYGYHVIKLLAKTPAGTRTLEEVRPSLAGDLTERKAEAETERLGAELAGKIRASKPKSDEELRKLQSDMVTYNSTEWFGRTGPIAGIGANAEFSNEAWSGKIGDVSGKPIATSRGPAFVRPLAERPAAVQPFEEVRAAVAENWKTERKEKDAIEKLQPAARELASGTGLTALATRYETEVKTTPEFGPAGPVPDLGAAPRLLEAVFQTPAGQAGPPVPVPSGFVLFRVLARTQADPATYATQKAALADSLRAKEAERLIRSVTLQMREDRKIEINEELLNSLLPPATKPS
ncbi:MAG: peptidyl-prolyl cis-trans isomerase [Acidobacteriota bacterium]|nr:peptidyl-prolyl cis-trans isomerase [Acidobacteriota bacterium]